MDLLKQSNGLQSFYSGSFKEAKPMYATANAVNKEMPTGTIIGTTDTQTLSAKTLTSPVLNAGVSGTAFLDDDSFATATATTFSSSESIKAYVDAQIATENTLAEMDDVVGIDYTAGTVIIGDGSDSMDQKAISGDATLASTGALTVASIGGDAVTLGGSFTTSGAFTTALTVTANTAVTLPTSGTLSTIAGTETLTNKTLTTPTIGSFTNSAHNHTNAAGGAQLTDAALSAAVGIAKGGTGATAKTAAFNALSPVTNEGDLIIRDGTNNIRLAIGGSGTILKSNGTTASWQSEATGLTFNQDTTTTLALAVNTQYTSSNAGLVTATLPATAAAGSVIEITRIGAGGLTIAQNANQLVHFGSSFTTTGVGGSLASTAQYDSIRVLCIVANTTFVVVHSVGSYTIA